MDAAALSPASERTAGPADQVLAGVVPGSEASDPKPIPLFGAPRADTKGKTEKPLTEVLEKALLQRLLIYVVN